VSFAQARTCATLVEARSMWQPHRVLVVA
jgi:hypothetical protein